MAFFLGGNTMHRVCAMDRTVLRTGQGRMAIRRSADLLGFAVEPPLR